MLKLFPVDHATSKIAFDNADITAPMQRRDAMKLFALLQAAQAFAPALAGEAKTATTAESLAAMCVWEWTLDLPAGNPFHAVIGRWRDAHGAGECRDAALAMGRWCETVYSAMDEDARDGFAFDWEIVPAALALLKWDDVARDHASRCCPDLPDAKATAALLSAEFGERWRNRATSKAPAPVRPAPIAESNSQEQAGPEPAPVPVTPERGSDRVADMERAHDLLTDWLIENVPEGVNWEDGAPVIDEVRCLIGSHSVTQSGGIELPGHGEPGDLFKSLRVRAKHYTGRAWCVPSPANPANVFSVEARTVADEEAGGICLDYVLTDHGTQDDADACAKLLSALTGLPVEA